ncbi:MAG: permease-like cell division protein FtsX [Acutalibacteraceae bacterium]|nr:permease-like cell division protein FtsX [Clostridia bacterium]MEE3449518.1 permease-like cell division protein FtsX [Acutalibacteraceae bacterium]
MRGIGYLFKEGVKSVWNNRMMSLASIGVLVSCLLITGAAVLLSMNVNSVVESVGKENQVTVFLNDNVKELEAVMEIGPEIRRVDNVSDCVFYSKDEAISQLQDELGNLFSELQGENNPLPHAFHVTMVDLSQYDETVKGIMQVEGVYKVSDRSEVAGKLTSLNELVTQIGLWIVVVLGIISLFIISNSVRMTMYSRRFEISIMKSVGATDMFVRVPFVIEGIVLGLISGAIASAIIAFLYEGLIAAVQFIIPFSEISYSAVALKMTLSFIVLGMIIGAAGAAVSISRYLKMEGGEILGW